MFHSCLQWIGPSRTDMDIYLNQRKRSFKLWYPLYWFVQEVIAHSHGVNKAIIFIFVTKCCKIGTLWNKIPIPILLLLSIMNLEELIQFYFCKLSCRFSSNIKWNSIWFNVSLHVIASGRQPFCTSAWHLLFQANATCCFQISVFACKSNIGMRNKR